MQLCTTRTPAFATVFALAGHAAHLRSSPAATCCSLHAPGTTLAAGAPGPGHSRAGRAAPSSLGVTSKSLLKHARIEKLLHSAAAARASIEDEELDVDLAPN